MKSDVQITGNRLQITRTFDAPRARVFAAFADPAKYDLFDCKQLETERKALANRAAEYQGLMAKAETGVGGAVVGEMVYRNELIAIRGQSQLAEQAWRRNKCRETIPAAAMPVTPPSAAAPPAPPSRAGKAVY